MKKTYPLLSEKKLTLFEMLLGAAVILVFILNFRYVDMDSVTAWGLDFWDSLFGGHPGELYTHAAINVYGAFHKEFAGTLLHYIVLAVPMLPLWIAKTIFGFDVLGSYGCMIYVKFVYAAAFVLLMFAALKICRRLGFDKNDRILFVFLCATSSFAVIPLFAFGQYDIYVAVLVMFGILALIDGKNFAFCLLFAFASALKPFALLVFIPILLLKEKKIARIILCLLPTAVVYAFFTLVSMPFPGYSEAISSSEGNASIIGGMLSSELNLSFGSVSLFFAAFAALAVYAYIKKTDEKTGNEFIVYLSFLSFAVYFVLCKFQGYRIIMILPLLYMVILMNKDSIRLTLIADIIAGAGFVFGVPLYEEWAMQNMRGYSDGAFSRLAPAAHSVQTLLSAEAASGKQSVAHYALEIFASLFVFGMAAVAVLCAPSVKKKMKSHQYCACFDKPLVWIRTLVPLGFAAMRLLTVL